MRDRLWLLAGAVTGFGVVILIAFVIYDVHNGKPAEANPPQQYTGHVSDNNLRNGITAVEITVRGRRIPCVYASAPGSSGGWSGGVAITCNWGARP